MTRSDGQNRKGEDGEKTENENHKLRMGECKKAPVQKVFAGKVDIMFWIGVGRRSDGRAKIERNSVQHAISVFVAI